MQRIAGKLLWVTALLATACSTTVDTRTALEEGAIGTFEYERIDVSAGDSAISADDLERLKRSVGDRLAALPRGTHPVTLQLTVVEFRVVSGGARFFGGALAGNNTMTVAVEVRNGAGGVVADFDVVRDANPGGYGAFYDQKAATISSVAEAIAEVLSGSK